MRAAMTLVAAARRRARLLRARAAAGERGSVAIMAVAALVLITTVVMLVLRTGHASTVKRELQSAADAAAMGLAADIRENGVATAPGADGVLTVPPALRAIVATHTKLKVDITAKLHDTVREGGTVYAVVGVKLVAQYESPFNVLKQSKSEIVTRARARVRQTAFGGNARWPAAVLMLDRSASMKSAVKWGGSRSRWDVLKDIVRAFVQRPLPLRMGLLMYTGGVDSGQRRVAPPRSNNFNAAAINNALAGTSPDSSFFASTNFKKVLDAARSMLSGDRGTRKSVVIISDGNPTSGASLGGLGDLPGANLIPGVQSSADAARNAGRNLRNAGVTVHAVGLRTVGHSGVLGTLTKWLEGSSVLPSVAGPANGPGGDRDHAHVVDIDSVNDTQRFLGLLAASFCAFPVTPLTGRDGRPLALTGDKRKIFAYIDDGNGDEEPLPITDDLARAAANNQVAFQYLPGASELRLSLEACYRLGRDARRKLVVRWGNAELVGSPDAPTINSGSGSSN